MILTGTVTQNMKAPITHLTVDQIIDTIMIDTTTTMMIIILYDDQGTTISTSQTQIQTPIITVTQVILHVDTNLQTLTGHQGLDISHDVTGSVTVDILSQETHAYTTTLPTVHKM